MDVVNGGLPSFCDSFGFSAALLRVDVFFDETVVVPLLLRDVPLRPFLFVLLTFSCFSSPESIVPVVGVSESDVRARLYSFCLDEGGLSEMPQTKQRCGTLLLRTFTAPSFSSSSTTTRACSFVSFRFALLKDTLEYSIMVIRCPARIVGRTALG